MKSMFAKVFVILILISLLGGMYFLSKPNSNIKATIVKFEVVNKKSETISFSLALRQKYNDVISVLNNKSIEYTVKGYDDKQKGEEKREKLVDVSFEDGMGNGYVIRFYDSLINDVIISSIDGQGSLIYNED